MITDILQTAITKYGKNHQCTVAIEELSELQKELCKAMRGKPDVAHITEEMADVWIMLEQIKIMFGISTEDVGKIASAKLLRLEKRMSEQAESEV